MVASTKQFMFKNMQTDYKQAHSSKDKEKTCIN